MNQSKSLLHTYPLTWAPVLALLVLAAVAAVISTRYPTAQASHVHKPGNLVQTPTAQAGSIQPDCQALPECGYIQMHTGAQSLAGSGPVGQVNAPVLTPACDGLPECEYIRAHIQANGGVQP